jgi:hypothetical protein
MTAGEALRHPLESLDVAEIEPAVVEASRFFERVNRRPLADPRTHLKLEDARQVLRRAERRYDAIVSHPSNPWLAGPSRLFTEEFFRLARARLEPGGLYVQWLQSYALAPDRVKAVARTFLAVFPHAALFEPGPGDLLLIGSESPIVLDPGRIGRAMGPVGDGLKPLGIEDAWDVLARWRMGTEDLRRFAGPGPLNTDDNGLLEFAAPLDLLADTIEVNRRHVLAGAGDALRHVPGWTQTQALDLARAQLGAGAPELSERSARRAGEAAPSPAAQTLLAASLRGRWSRQSGEGSSRSGDSEDGLRGAWLDVVVSARKRWPRDPGLAEEEAAGRLERAEPRAALAAADDAARASAAGAAPRVGESPGGRPVAL